MTKKNDKKKNKIKINEQKLINIDFHFYSF